MIKKILYVHYQRAERDGSFVHTREFEAAFRKLCAVQGIQFTVLAPPLLLSPRVLSKKLSFLGRIKRKLGQYYSRDIKVLMVQVWRFFREWRYLKRERPDIVLTRFDDDTLSILWVCRWLGIPSVIEVNGPERDELIAQLRHARPLRDAIEVNGPEFEETSMYYRQIPFLKKLFTNRHALELANGAFAVSEQLSAPMRIAQNAKPIITIPNGVDIERFDPAISGAEVRRRLGIAEDAMVYGYIGSFAPWHGLDLLVDAFTRLLKEHPSIHLLLVGQANAQWQELLDRVTGPDLAAHVAITGFVLPPDIPAYLAVMDITVLPNSAPYCSPLKLLEYMAMAKPTVAVCTSPIAATLRNGDEGLLFDQGNVDALAAALGRLTQDRKLRARMGAAARRRVERDYTWRHNAEQIFGLLDRVYQQSLQGTVDCA